MAFAKNSCNSCNSCSIKIIRVIYVEHGLHEWHEWEHVMKVRVYDVRLGQKQGGMGAKLTISDPSSDYIHPSK